MKENIREIAIEDIQPDPDNLRKTFDSADIDSLAENLTQIGQTDPIQVFARGNERGRVIYDLFDGERRWRAAKAGGLKTLSAIIIPRPSENDLLVRKISRMMQTRDYTFQEQVTALETGLKALGVWDRPDEWGKVAPKLGVKAEQLRERMRIVRLSPKLREQFFEGELDYTIAHQLGRLDDHRRQAETATFIKQNHLSNRFVTAKFMTTVIKNPGKPLIEIYDLARKELADSVYGKTRLGTEIKKTLQQKVNDFIDALMGVEKELEQGARGGFFRDVFVSDFEKARTLGALARLKNVIEGFLEAAEPIGCSSGENELPSSQPKHLPMQSERATVKTR
ncbi:MAG TPA: ParB/RepB/Spo0J family partition protein [Candidatus Acidoferrales bacterium]|nr:ParB/RepB/Spo0J family partition protein [Candidatus Acidoferrales bacterium]